MLERAAAAASAREEAALAECRELEATLAELRQQQQYGSYNAEPQEGNWELEQRLKEQVGVWAGVLQGLQLVRTDDCIAGFLRAVRLACECFMEGCRGDERQPVNNRIWRSCRALFCLALPCAVLPSQPGVVVLASVQIFHLERTVAEATNREHAARAECNSLERTIGDLRHQLQSLDEASKVHKSELEQSLREQVSVSRCQWQLHINIWVRAARPALALANLGCPGVLSVVFVAGPSTGSSSRTS